MSIVGDNIVGSSYSVKIMMFSLSYGGTRALSYGGTGRIFMMFFYNFIYF